MYSFTYKLALAYLESNGFISRTILTHLIKCSFPDQILQKMPGKKKYSSYWCCKVFWNLQKKCKNKEPKYVRIIKNGRVTITLVDMSNGKKNGIDEGKLDM